MFYKAHWRTFNHHTSSVPTRHLISVRYLLRYRQYRGLGQEWTYGVNKIAIEVVPNSKNGAWIGSYTNWPVILIVLLIKPKTLLIPSSLFFSISVTFNFGKIITERRSYRDVEKLIRGHESKNSFDCDSEIGSLVQMVENVPRLPGAFEIVVKKAWKWQIQNFLESCYDESKYLKFTLCFRNALFFSNYSENAFLYRFGIHFEAFPLVYFTFLMVMGPLTGSN